MRLYRVSVYTDHGSSNGFIWCASHRAAETAAKQAHENEPEERFPEIEVIDLLPTKKDVLRLLNRYASEPQNG